MLLMVHLGLHIVLLFGGYLVTTGFRKSSYFGFCGRATSTYSTSSIIDWCIAQGSKKEEIKIRIDDDVRNNIRATAAVAVERGESLITIPLSTCIDTDKVSKRISQIADKSQLKTGSLGVLALFLALEKCSKKPSSIAPYLNSLPAQPTTITAWNDDDLHILYKSTTRNVEHFINNVEEDVELLQGLDLDEPSSSTLANEFEWAMGIVRSRSVVFDGQPILLPGIDSMSFDPLADNEPQLVSAGLFGGKVVKVIADRSYKPGDEVFVSFGLKSSAECLEDHGFVPNVDLDSSTCELEVWIDEEKDRFPDDKANILEDNKQSSRMKFDLVADSSVGIDPDLIRFLRLKLITGKDAFILESIFSPTVFDTLALPFSQANEVAVFQYIVDFCHRQLDKINSVGNIDSDKQLSLQGKRKAALMAKLRLQERRALEVNLQLAADELLNIQGSGDIREYYQERRLRELNLVRPLDDSEIVPTD